MGKRELEMGKQRAQRAYRRPTITVLALLVHGLGGTGAAAGDPTSLVRYVGSKAVFLGSWGGRRSVGKKGF